MYHHVILLIFLYQFISKCVYIYIFLHVHLLFTVCLLPVSENSIVSLNLILNLSGIE
jgi:hypothetical protein